MRKALLSSVSASVLGLGLLTPAAFAPADAITVGGDFEITITSMSGFPTSAPDPSKMKKPESDCTVGGKKIDPFSYTKENPLTFSSDQLFSCSMSDDQSLPALTVSGNAKQLSSGKSGTFEMTCEIRMVNASSFVVGMTAIQSYSVSQSGYRSCSFEVKLDGSTLSGSMTSNVTGVISLDSISDAVPCPSDVLSMFTSFGNENVPDVICAESTMNATASVTGGTGVFEGLKGSGDYSAKQITPLIVPIKMVDAGSSSSGSSGGPTGGAANPGGLPSGATEIACPAWYTGTGKCYSIPGSSDPYIDDPAYSGARIAQKGVGMNSPANLKLTLAKGATKPQVVVPALVNGKRVLGIAPGSTKAATFSLATAPSAKCTMVGKGNGKAVKLGAVKADSGGTAQSKLTSAVLQKKLKAKVGSSVTVSAACVSAGKKLAPSTTKFQLG